MIENLFSKTKANFVKKLCDVLQNKNILRRQNQCTVIPQLTMLSDINYVVNIDNVVILCRELLHQMISSVKTMNKSTFENQNTEIP